MKLFDLLGLKPQQAFVKKAQPATVEAAESSLSPLGEKPRWSRPGHTIERNEMARAKALALANLGVTPLSGQPSG